MWTQFLLSTGDNACGDGVIICILSRDTMKIDLIILSFRVKMKVSELYKLFNAIRVLNPEHDLVMGMIKLEKLQDTDEIPERTFAKIDAIAEYRGMSQLRILLTKLLKIEKEHPVPEKVQEPCIDDLIYEAAQYARQGNKEKCLETLAKLKNHEGPSTERLVSYLLACALEAEFDCDMFIKIFEALSNEYDTISLQNMLFEEERYSRSLKCNFTELIRYYHKQKDLSWTAIRYCFNHVYIDLLEEILPSFELESSNSEYIWKLVDKGYPLQRITSQSTKEEVLAILRGYKLIEALFKTNNHMPKLIDRLMSLKDLTLLDACNFDRKLVLERAFAKKNQQVIDHVWN